VDSLAFHITVNPRECGINPGSRLIYCLLSDMGSRFCSLFCSKIARGIICLLDSILLYSFILQNVSRGNGYQTILPSPNYV